MPRIKKEEPRHFLSGIQMLRIAQFLQTYVPRGKRQAAKQDLFSIIKEDHMLFKTKVLNNINKVY